MPLFPLCLFLAIEVCNRFCFVTCQKGGSFALRRGSGGNRRGQNDVSESVLGQDNWVGFEILWLEKLGSECGHIFGDPKYTHCFFKV